MLKSIRNLDYVVLLCNNLPRMIHFYNKVMGFPIHLETESWIEMQVGGVLLTLSKRDRPWVGAALPAFAHRYLFGAVLVDMPSTRVGVRVELF